MGTIDRRTSTNGTVAFRARARLKGCPGQSAVFSSKTDAKRWIAATESALREGRYFATAEAKRHTLSEMLERYARDVLPTKPRNARNQQHQLTWWKTELGAYRLLDITPAKIAECRDRLLSHPAARGKRRAPATAVRYLAVLSHAFSIAMREWGWVDDNPCRKVSKPREPRGRVRFLDDAERGRLLEACRSSKSALLYPIVVVALATGMRKGEIMSLRWPQIDVARASITLLETKNGERRSIPIEGRALQLLSTLSDARRVDTQLVFPNDVGAKPIEIAKAWTTAVAKASVTDFRFHDLRHTTASYLAQGGATDLDIAALLGHKTLAMVKRYAHLSESRVRAVVAEMNQRTLSNV